jgi:hypothetical protein
MEQGKVRYYKKTNVLTVTVYTAISENKGNVTT